VSTPLPRTWGKRRLPSVTTLRRTLQACWAAAVYAALTVSAQACESTARPVATANSEQQPANVAQDMVFQTSVVPHPDEDLAAPCRYEITLTSPSRRVQGVWVIFEPSRDMLLYYRDADVRTFARRHDLALLFPFHCQSNPPRPEGT
jgi:hypothetical protein